MRKSETINKFLNNRVTWIIVSLLISFFVWAYMAGSDTTTFNQTFYNVPVVFQGADALRSTKGLIITDPDAETVTIQVRGSRASIGSLHASELQAIVDVSGISQARETELTYTIVFPDRINRSDISVVSRTPETIGFTVAAESTKTVEVKGVFTGSIAEGYMEDPVQPEMIFLRRDKSVSLQGGFFKQIQLVFGKIQLLRHFIFIGRNETRNVLLDQFDGRSPTGFAIVAQRTILALRQLEGDRMILVVATPAFLVLCHNTLI